MLWKFYDVQFTLGMNKDADDTEKVLSNITREKKQSLGALVASILVLLLRGVEA